MGSVVPPCRPHPSGEQRAARVTCLLASSFLCLGCSALYVELPGMLHMDLAVLREV